MIKNQKNKDQIENIIYYKFELKDEIESKKTFIKELRKK
jgi:hypothetical protein